VPDRPVIELVDVSKAYRVYRKLSDVLKEGLLGGERHDLFWALRGISFSVTEGERIGIVGPNGAGKSTLLKLITGNLAPSGGRLSVNGRISALLSLIPALRKNETGLENIKLNLLLAGVSRREVGTMVDDIIDFTELSSFIYQPVRTYSSGMQARLAFAVATAVTPEILIVDEVLGTGDAYFQSKAEARMRDLCARGKALLFVSHATAALRNLCDRVIWLENGETRMDSNADYVLTRYEEDAKRQQDLRTRSGNIVESIDGSREVGATVDLFREGRVYLRVVAAEGKRLRDTHFLTAFRVALDDRDEFALSLEQIDLENSEHPAALALLGTEWGRLHSHAGRECRELSAKIGRMPGGMFSVKTKSAGRAGRSKVRVRFESAAERGDETLGLEYFDVVSREWCRLPLRRSPAADGPWILYDACEQVPLPPRDEIEVSRQSYMQESMPAVTIGEVTAVSWGERVTSFIEGTPFGIRVEVKVNKPVPIVDVCLKIMRNDGVYVFWQSSGFEDGGCRNAVVDFRVMFRFEPNLFGPGRYQVSVTLGNGWDLKRNYPHSQVFDRKVNVAAFDVRRQHPELEFGIVKMIVPVSKEYEPTKFNETGGSGANAGG